MTARRTYDDIKIGCFKLMYLARQRIVKRKREWLHPIEVVGVAFMDWEYDSVGMEPLKRLMYETIFLVLCAGLAPEPGRTNAISKIEELLCEHNLDELIADIPEDEQRELRIDLEILGFLPPDITKPQFAKS